MGSEHLPPDVWPLALYFALALALTGAMIGLSYVLGERHKKGVGQATEAPYESGIVSFGSARLRMPAKFYLVALFFVIFDLEAVFVFAWAVALYDVGWRGYAEMSVFVGILLAGLIYLWRLGALDWASARTARVGKHAR